VGSGSSSCGFFTDRLRKEVRHHCGAGEISGVENPARAKGRGSVAEGLAPDKPDSGGPHEQNDSDDREPEQAFEGETDDRCDKPDHEQNDDED
jgi:hypothetical protein